MIRAAHRLLLLGMLALFSGASIRAEDDPEALDKWNPPPPPPAAGLMDDGGLFQRNPSIAANIEELLERLNERHHFRIYLVVEPVIITSTPPDLAESLRLAWLPDGNGIVVVYESDTRSLGIGRRMAEDPAGEGPRVPTHVSAVIINEVIASTDKSLTSEEYLKALTANLTASFDDYFQRRAIGPPKEQSWKLALTVVAVAAALGLCAIGVAALARLKSVRGERTFHFHPVDRPERLQAPSGASVTSINFRSSTSPPPPRNGAPSSSD